MGVGLTIYNDKYNLQIDADYQNLSLGTVTRVPAGRSEPTRLFDTWQSKPIFAMQPDPNNEFMTFHKNYSTGYQGTGTIYNFEDDPIKPLSTGFGLELYDSLGNVTFTSQKKGIRIIDYIKLSNRNNVNHFWSKNYGTKEVAFIPTKAPMGFAGMNANQAVAYGLSFRMDSTGLVTATMSSFAPVPPAIGESIGNTYDVEFLVIDTSNY